MTNQIDIDDLPTDVRTAVQQRLERIEQELEAMGDRR
jgi:hypothetical protein